MEKLYADYFNFHFTNWPTPKGRNGCYICYEVERRLHNSPISLVRGVFENEVQDPQYCHLRHRCGN